MSSSSSSKSDARRRTDQDHETEQITYGHFNPGVGHDIPGAGGRRRTENVPPGPQATLETSREEYQQFVERETSRDPASLSTTPRFPESTAAAAAAATTNFTIPTRCSTHLFGKRTSLGLLHILLTADHFHLSFSVFIK